MLEGSYLPPLQNYHHRTPDRIPVPPPRVLLVRTSPQNHQRSRPSLHIPFRLSVNQRTGDSTKHLNCLPPTDRWPYRTNKPVGRTISAADNRKPRGLE